MSEPIAFQFKSRGTSAALIVVAFRGQEAISRPYEFEIDLKSDSAELDLDALLSAGCSLEIEVGGGKRRVHGILSACEEMGQSGEFTFYKAVLVPRLWQLSLFRANEVYLDQSVPDVIETVLEEGGFSKADYELRLTRTYRRWTYRCQFGETHLDFVQRLMEHEGIYYYFAQADGQEKLIVADHLQHHDDLPGEALNYGPPSGLELSGFQDKVHALVCRQSRLPAKVLLRDYNDQNPSVDIKGEAEVDSRGVGEVYLYGENVESPDEGRALAGIRAEELRQGKSQFHGEGTAARLTPGYFARLENHFRASFNRKYLITAVEHEGSLPSLMAGAPEGAPSYANSFTAIASDVQFRPARVTPKPRFYGTLNAVIDGEGDGKYAEVDDLGRYKVVLSFDRVRRQEGKASCWIRMAQPFSGEAEGMHFPLRKGAEVLLTFIGGDPDRPVIAGAVPNARQPSVVTSENQTNSKIKTSGGNFIEMEDREDSRRIKLYSPHNDTYLHLGAPNHDGDGVALLTLGLVRNEWLGGQLQTVVARDQRAAASATGASSDQYDERGQLHVFKKKDGSGAGTTDMTAAEELSGNYAIVRRKAPLYVWSEGDEYYFGGGKVFNYGGGGYEETHANEDGIDRGETFPMPTSMSGASDYNLDTGFVEKSWGNTYTYQRGNNYAWGDTRDYAFGNGYAENHVSGEGPVNGSYDHDSYSGTLVTVDPDSTLVEKTLGNTYSYQRGNALEVMVGNAESRTWGDSREEVHGNSNSEVHGDSDETIHGDSTSEVHGDSEEHMFGKSNSWQIGAVEELVVAPAASYNFGISMSVTMGMPMEIALGGIMQIAAGTLLNINSGIGVDMEHGMIEDSFSKIDVKGATVGSAAANVLTGGLYSLFCGFILQA